MPGIIFFLFVLYIAILFTIAYFVDQTNKLKKEIEKTNNSTEQEIYLLYDYIDKLEDKIFTNFSN